MIGDHEEQAELLRQFEEELSVKFRLERNPFRGSPSGNFGKCETLPTSGGSC
jgi:hypothetical protein